MSFYSTRYRSGDEIRAGDCVMWGGKTGQVLFVLGRPEVVDGWREFMDQISRDYREEFAVETDIAGVVFEYESDEDLGVVTK